MADKKLEEYPAINEAWKAVRSERIVHPSGMVISRVVRVPTFGVYKRDLEKNAASIFMSEVEKVAAVPGPPDKVPVPRRDGRGIEYIPEKDAKQIPKTRVGQTGWEPVKIKEVDGGKVKVEHNMDFVEGGHDKVYPKFIPKGEVWVDKNLAPKERPFVKFHELIERARMRKGESYEKAHEVANKAEKAARLASKP